MEHSVFVEKYWSNQIAVDIDKNKAGFMYEQQGLMPQDLRVKQVMIRTLAFGGVIAALVLFFIAPWWAGAGVLLLALYTFPKAQKNAAEGVLSASLSNPHIFNIALKNHVLRIRDIDY